MPLFNSQRPKAVLPSKPTNPQTVRNEVRVKAEPDCYFNTIGKVYWTKPKLASLLNTRVLLMSLKIDS